MAHEKTFLIGLGNQKCGTSWLYKYLLQDTNFNSGFAKEYHIWDALDIDFLKKYLVDSKSRYFGRGKWKRYKMQHEKEFYFDYFEALYSEQTNISGDITPSYSGLDIPRLQFIRNQFAKRDISTKAVILIREPISRIKSAVRFNLDRRNYSEGIKYGETDFTLALGQYYKTEHCRLRTSYQLIIPRAFEVFGEANVYVGIYENMFELAEIERLSQFCGVSVNADFAKVYVNKTKNSVEEDASLERELRSAYDDVYKYCNEKFPSTQYLWS